MVKYDPEQVDLLFHALSDATRRAIIARLVQGEAHVSELAQPFDISLAAVSKHLKVLERAQFVEKTREGRSFRCRARPEALDAVSEVLEGLGAFWRDRLMALDSFLQQETLKEEKQDGRGKKRT